MIYHPSPAARGREGVLLLLHRRPKSKFCGGGSVVECVRVRMYEKEEEEEGVCLQSNSPPSSLNEWGIGRFQ